MKGVSIIIKYILITLVCLKSVLYYTLTKELDIKFEIFINNEFSECDTNTLATKEGEIVVDYEWVINCEALEFVAMMAHEAFHIFQNKMINKKSYEIWKI